MLLARWDADVSDEVGRGVACEAELEAGLELPAM